MAQIETWLKCDLKKPVQVHALPGNVFSADNNANLIGVELFNDGVAEPVSGGVIGYAIREDGATVIINGSSDGNKAYIVLPKSAYVVVGQLSVVIKIGTTTVGACTGNVYRTTTETIVDPGHVVPSIEDLLAKIADCEAATAAANQAATNANAKATQANAAAENANEKATLANTAAGTANTAAENATAKAEEADEAATKIDDMTVAVNQGDYSLPPRAELTLVDGHYVITFYNVKGLKGDTGDAFHVVKTYASVAEMNADYAGTDTAVGDYVMITTNVEDPDNAKVYIKGSQAWQFVVDMSGATGLKGDTGNGIASAVLNQDYTLTLNFTDGTTYTTIPIKGERGERGVQGIQGERGFQGIQGIQGVPGPAGASGVVVSGAGLFTIEMEPNGDLYVVYEDANDAPNITYDSATGNLYWEYEESEES